MERNPDMNRELTLRNSMQLDLLEEVANGENLDEFFKKHPKEFEDFSVKFAELINQHPELLSRYEENGYEALEEAKKYLYH